MQLTCHLLHKDHLVWMGSLCPIFPQNSMPFSEWFFSDSFFPVIQDCYSSLCSILLNCVSLLSRGCMFCPLLSLRTGPSPGPDQESEKNGIEPCAWSELLLSSMPCLQGFPKFMHTCADTAPLRYPTLPLLLSPATSPWASSDKVCGVAGSVFEGSEMEALGQGKLFSFQDCGG